MNNKDISCPACGSKDIEIMNSEFNVSEVYSDNIKVKIKNCRCKTCDTEGDFLNENDTIINKALNEAKMNSLTNIIRYFEEHGYSKAAIERVLNLPQKTLSKWKNRRRMPNATGLSLMKIIRTYPWILDVAETDFNEIESKEILIKNGFDTYKQSNIETRGICNSKDKIMQHISFNKDKADNIETQSNKFPIVESKWMAIGKK